MKEYPYWLDTLANPQSAIRNPQSEIRSRADVAVIGAGYTGLSAARRLARAGASVIVFERGEVGAGASSRNGGQVLTGLKLDAATLVRRFGETKARRLFDVASEAMATLEGIIAQEAIDCGFARCGHLQAASKPRHFDAFRDEQELLARVFDHRVEVISRRDQRNEIGSDAYHGLLLDERSAALNPAQYVEGLAAAARRSGACVLPGHAVTRIERMASGWRITASSDVEVRDVLVATDGYTTSVTPALQRRLIPVGSFIVATEPLPAATAAALLPRGRVAFDSKYFLHYYRLAPDGRLLFGGRAEFRQPDARAPQRAAAILRADMARVFPQLKDVRIEYAWGGNVAFSRDEMPRAGVLEGQYYAGAYCGHGIAMATYLGDLVARRMAGEPLDHPLFDDRFAAVPLYRGTPWFLPFVGAYYRVKDWLL